MGATGLEPTPADPAITSGLPHIPQIGRAESGTVATDLPADVLLLASRLAALTTDQRSVHSPVRPHSPGGDGARGSGAGRMAGRPLGFERTVPGLIKLAVGLG